MDFKYKPKTYLEIEERSKVSCEKGKNKLARQFFHKIWIIKDYKLEQRVFQ